MLTELKLTNFRIFDDEVTVRFRPITVLIGRNSSGKSTIIKFLLMLQQSMGPGKTQFLSPEGDLVNLGVFAELKNALTRKRDLHFELTANSLLTPLPRSVSRYLGPSEKIDPGKLVYKADATVSYSGSGGRDSVGYSVMAGMGGESFLSADIPKGAGLKFWDYPPPPDDLDSLLEADDSEESIEEITDRLEKHNALVLRLIGQRGIIDTIRREVAVLRHLTPVRAEAERVIVASPPPIDSVGQKGQYALPYLQRMMDENREDYEFLLPHLEGVAGLEDVEFKTFTRPRRISQAFAKNKTTGANVHIADYGFGVSQCLPIFVQGAIMPAYTTLMVEQPEAQLHPTAQLEMGSYFADLWQQRQVGSIIETHSDNILLRLRRLVALGKLASQDVSVAYFTFDENNPGMPTVKNLDINPDGSMEAGLPMEFFGADVIEGLKLGAGI